VEGSAPFKTKEEESVHRVRARDIGPLATLDSFGPTDCKSRMVVINLDQVASYEGTAQDKWP
jgi:hypothetical protein